MLKIFVGGRSVKINRYLLPRIIAKIKNRVIDVIYSGTFLGGTIEPVTEDAYDTQSSDYKVLEWLFDKVSIDANDVIVDVGCGKGRVLLWLINNDYHNKLVGVELNEEIADKTKKRLSQYPNITIIAGSILENIPEDATVFYLFSPFNEKITAEFKEKLSAKPNITIIYSNATHVDVFKDDDNWDVTEYDVTIPVAGIENYPAAIITTKANK